MSNENFAVQIKLCLAAVLGTLTALWGWFGWLVLVWAALSGAAPRCGPGPGIRAA